MAESDDSGLHQGPDLAGSLETEKTHSSVGLENVATLTYVPQCFQDPLQLLLLKHAQFHRLHTECCLAVCHLSCAMAKTQINSHTAIIGLSTNTELFPFASTETELRVLSGSVLSALFGAVSELQDCKVIILDKLDMIEHLNPSIMRWRSDIIHCGVDPDECDRETEIVEFEFSSLLQNAKEIPSVHLQRLFQSLICTYQYSPVLFSDVCGILMQHIYWIDSTYLEAFLDVSSARVLPATGEDVRTFHLTEAKEVKYVCSGALDPSALLEWYSNKLIEEILVHATEEWKENLRQMLRQLTATSEIKI